MSQIASGEWDWLFGQGQTDGGIIDLLLGEGASDQGAARNIVDILGPIGEFIANRRAVDQARASQEAANRANEERYQQVLGLLGQAQDLTAGQFNQTGEVLRGLREGATNQLNETGQVVARGRDIVRSGFDRARNEVNTLGMSAARDIRDRGTRAAAETTSSLQSRGIGNTSVLDSARRAVHGDTERNLGDLNERMAGLRAGIQERGTLAEAGANRDLASFMLNRTGIETGLGSELARFMERRTQAETGLLERRGGAIERRSDLSNNLAIADLLARAQGSSRSGGGGGGLGGILGAVGSIAGSLFG